MKKLCGGGVSQDTSTIQTDSKHERNIGIDALRIFSMFLIVVLHVLEHGRVLENATGANKYILSFVNVSACCAVDIYALISGFVGYTDKPKPFKSAKFLTMWSQVFSYSFGIVLCAFLIKPESISIKTLIRSVFPIASNQYWYFSCYIALFLLMPWINHFIRSLSNKKLTTFVILLFGLFPLFMLFSGRLAETDPFVLEYGGSTIWLTILYIIGAWMKRIEVPNKIQTRYARIIIVFCIFVSWISHDVFTGFLHIGILVNNTSPTILAVAVSFLIVFSKVRLHRGAEKIITFFAPAAFGVYLIHDNGLIRSHFISQYFGWISHTSPLMVAFVVIGCSLGILLLGLSIEKLRQWVFKTLKINFVIMEAGKKIDHLLNCFSDKIDSMGLK